MPDTLENLIARRDVLDRERAELTAEIVRLRSQQAAERKTAKPTGKVDRDKRADRREKAVAMRNEGMTMAAIAKELGFSVGGVTYAIQRAEQRQRIEQRREGLKSQV